MNAIVVRQPNLNDWSMIQAIAVSSRESRKLGITKVEEAEIKLLTAWENGLPLTSAFQAVHIINGVPTLSPKAVWARIIVHPEFGGFKEERLEVDNKFFGYRLTLLRKSGVQATRQFTLVDAKRAGLDKKDNWVAYPENMCFWRSLGFVQDVVFADVTLGMSRADEMGASITADGDVIEGSWTVSRPAQSAPDEPDALQLLVEKHGVEAVLEANGGSIPGTPEEIAAIAEKLGVFNGSV